MSLLQETKLLCKQYDILPSKSKGQNFLINENVYQTIIEVANLNKKDLVLEVGPGFGILTKLLCQNAGQVVAVELDDKLFNYLEMIKEISGLDNLKLQHKNILDWQPEELDQKNYKIVANLPYNITSFFLRKFLTTDLKPTEMILLLQKEVAQRLAAKPGQMSLLAISAQLYSDVEIIETVSNENFWPQPEVDSAIIKLTIKDKPLAIDEKNFFRLVKIGFSAKRKKLANNLANGFHQKPAEIVPILESLKINPNARAQELSLENWLKLNKLINQ